MCLSATLVCHQMNEMVCELCVVLHAADTVGGPLVRGKMLMSLPILVKPIDPVGRLGNTKSSVYWSPGC